MADTQTIEPPGTETMTLGAFRKKYVTKPQVISLKEVRKRFALQKEAEDGVQEPLRQAGIPATLRETGIGATDPSGQPLGGTAIAPEAYRAGAPQTQAQTQEAGQAGVPGVLGGKYLSLEEIEAVFNQLPPDPNAPAGIEMGQQPRDIPHDIQGGIQILRKDRPLRFRPGEGGTTVPRAVTQGFKETLPAMFVIAALNKGELPQRPEDFTWAEGAVATIISIGVDPTFWGSGGIGNIAARGAMKAGARTLLGGVGRELSPRILERALRGGTTLGIHGALRDILVQEAQTGKVDPLQAAKAFGESAFMGTVATPLGLVPKFGLITEILGFAWSQAWLQGRAIPTGLEIADAGVTILGIKVGNAAASGLGRLATGKTLSGEQRRIQRKISPEERFDIIFEAISKADARKAQDIENFIKNPSRANALKLKVPKAIRNSGEKRKRLADVMAAQGWKKVYDPEAERAQLEKAARAKPAPPGIVGPELARIKQQEQAEREIRGRTAKPKPKAKEPEAKPQDAAKLEKAPSKPTPQAAAKAGEEVGREQAVEDSNISRLQRVDEKIEALVPKTAPGGTVGGSPRAVVYEAIGFAAPNKFREGSQTRDDFLQRIGLSRLNASATINLSDKSLTKELATALFIQEAQSKGQDAEGILGPSSSLTDAGKIDAIKSHFGAAEKILEQIQAELATKPEKAPSKPEATKYARLVQEEAATQAKMDFGTTKELEAGEKVARQKEAQAAAEEEVAGGQQMLPAPTKPEKAPAKPAKPRTPEKAPKTAPEPGKPAKTIKQAEDAVIEQLGGSVEVDLFGPGQFGEEIGATAGISYVKGGRSEPLAKAVKEEILRKTGWKKLPPGMMEKAGESNIEDTLSDISGQGHANAESTLADIIISNTQAGSRAATLRAIEGLPSEFVSPLAREALNELIAVREYGAGRAPSKKKLSPAKLKQRKKMDKAIQDLMDEGKITTLGSGYINPKLVAKAIIVAKEYISYGAISFSEMMADLKGKIGAKAVKELEPALKAAWDDANRPADRGPAEIGEGGGREMSVKNAVVDQERARRGLPPRMAPLRQSHPEVFDEAMRRIQSEPHAQDVLIKALEDTPRAHTPVEAMMLGHRMVELSNEEAKAMSLLEGARKRKDDADIVTHQTAVELLKKEFQRAADVADKTGTEAGRSLEIRKALIAEDYTLVKMKRDATEAKGGEPLTTEQSSQLNAAEETIRKLRQERADLTEKLRVEQAKKATDKIIREAPKRQPPKPTKKVSQRVAEAKEEVASAWKHLDTLIAVRPTLRAVVPDAEMVEGFTRLAKAYLKQGKAQFQDFYDGIVKHIGKNKAEKLKREIETAWRIVPKPEAKPEKEAGPKEQPRQPRKIETAGQVSRFARKIARFFAEEHGILEREKLIDAVHEALSGVVDITRDQTMDALSLYGQYRLLSKGEIDVKLRQNYGEMQQLGKIRDMLEGKAGLLTGGERRTMSNEERGLVAQVNELKRREGYVVTDLETQIKGAQHARHTRLRNQIADLEQQIKSREKIVKKTTTLKPDAKSLKLMERRDTLKAEFEEIFGKEGLTDAEREVNILKQIEERILARTEEYKRMLRAGEFDPKPRRKRRTNPRLEKLRYKEELAKAKWMRALDKYRRANRTTTQKVSDAVPESMNLVRTIIVSADLSAVLRQGGIVGASHPLLAAKAIPAMMAAAKPFTGKAAASRIAHELENRPGAALRKRGGVEMTDPEGRLEHREELFRSRWAKLFPGVAMSERAFTTYLNQIRADLFDALAETLGRDGTVTDPEARLIGNYVNVVTGRGSLGRFKADSKLLSAALFAPRFMFSRFQYLALQPLWHPTKDAGRARKLIAKEYGRAITGLTLFYGSISASLFMALGPPGEDEAWDIELDWTSSDFGKIRIGDYRIDPLGGLSQVTVLIGRTVAGAIKGLTSGERETVRGEDVRYGRPGGDDVVINFFRNKFAPVLNTTLDVLRGVDRDRKAMTVGKVVKDLTIPISMRGVYSWMKASGIPAATSLFTLEFFGFGVQHHQGSQEKRAAFKEERIGLYSRRLGAKPLLKRGERGDSEKREKQAAFEVRQAAAVEWFTKHGISRRVERDYERWVDQHYTTDETRDEYKKRFRRNAKKIGR